MAEAFIGFVIAVYLQSGLKLTGTVAHIEPASQQMTLKDVELQFPGQPAHYTSVYGVSGTEITNLEVVSQAAAAAKPTTTTSIIRDVPHQKDDQPPTITRSTSKASSSQRQRYVNNDESATERSTDNNSNRPRQKKSTSTNSSNGTPKRSTSSGRRQQQQQGGNRQPNGKQQQQQQNKGWADEDVAGFIEKEFDFQANLNMFDKKKVFAEIREQDETAPETLLVTLNRLPRKNDSTQTNLLPTENVLDDEPKESNGEESDTESSTSSMNPGDRKAGVVHQKPVATIRTLDTHINCVVVSPLQMAHAEHECIKVTGPSEVQLIENGGRGVSALALQILGAKRIQSRKTPVIMVLTGNNKTGAYGIAAARHLTNHGCHVVVCASEQLQGLCDTIGLQASMFMRVGGDVIYDFEELNRWSPDLIIDAMVGSQHKVMEQEDEKEEYEALRRMIRWAGKQSASVLSIDFPSAIGGGRGRSADYCINPQWTVCLGAPKTGCLSTAVTGSLYMVDIGIPRTCWKRAGVKGWTVPWGASFLVELEYVS